MQLWTFGIPIKWIQLPKDRISSLHTADWKENLFLFQVLNLKLNKITVLYLNFYSWFSFNALIQQFSPALWKTCCKLQTRQVSSWFQVQNNANHKMSLYSFLFHELHIATLSSWGRSKTNMFCAYSTCNRSLAYQFFFWALFTLDVV